MEVHDQEARGGGTSIDIKTDGKENKNLLKAKKSENLVKSKKSILVNTNLFRIDFFISKAKKTLFIYKKFLLKYQFFIILR